VIIKATLTLFILALSLRADAGNQEVLRPDIVLQPTSPTHIMAGSPAQIVRIPIPTLQDKERWLQGIAYQPGDPRVVRSAFFYIDKTNLWLGGWVPGAGTIMYPETVAALLPAGAKVILELHYQSVDVDVDDLSSVGLYFTDRKPSRPLSGLGIETRVQIPPSGELFRLRKEFTVISDSFALALHPQMLSAARSLEVAALDSTGEPQILLAIKEIHGEEQPYVFDQPRFIPKGTRIVATASYEGSQVQEIEDLFKLTMTIYPSDEFRAGVDARPVVKRPVAKKPAAKRPAAKKRP
jgi:hypothetical protein